jgi:hypothetical protein
MSHKALMWTLAAILLVGVVTAFDVMRERRDGLVIAFSNGPISEELVLQKMTADGWTNVQVVRDGRYFQVTGSKEQQTSKFIVDSQTGRVRDDDDDD